MAWRQTGNDCNKIWGEIWWFSQQLTDCTFDSVTILYQIFSWEKVAQDYCDFFGYFLSQDLKNFKTELLKLALL